MRAISNRNLVAGDRQRALVEEGQEAGRSGEVRAAGQRARVEDDEMSFCLGDIGDVELQFGSGVETCGAADSQPARCAGGLVEGTSSMPPFVTFSELILAALTTPKVPLSGR